MTEPTTLPEQQGCGKPGCRGCYYAGRDLPCEYILITGRSPQKDGAHIDPEGRGGCELYTRGRREKRTERPTVPEKKARKRQPRAGDRRKKIDDVKCLELYGEGMTDRQLAEKMGVKTDTARKWRKARNLPPNGGKREWYRAPGQSRYNAPEVMRTWENGATDRELAEMTGTTTSAAKNWRYRNGLPCNQARDRREAKEDGSGTLLSGAGADGTTGE